MTFDEVYDELDQVPECPKQWYPIIVECHRKLLELDPHYTVDQVKEKFGGLRYYFSMSDENNGFTDSPYNANLYDEMSKVVDWAESEVEKLNK